MKPSWLELVGWRGYCSVLNDKAAMRVLRGDEVTNLVAGGKVKLTICRKMSPSNRYILGLVMLLMMWSRRTKPSGPLKLSSISVSII